MFRYLLTILILSGTSVYASPVLTLGAGVESRLNRDVNPDNTTQTTFTQLYLSLSSHPWSVLWEIGRAQNEDHVGNYSVKDIQYTTMIWGRYEPWSDWRLSPYVGLGLGWQIDDITSQFGSAVDTRFGDGGGIVGLGTGVMATFFNHWNVEAEARVSKSEMTNGPTWSVLLRSGFTFN